MTSANYYADRVELVESPALRRGRIAGVAFPVAIALLWFAPEWLACFGFVSIVAAVLAIEWLWRRVRPLPAILTVFDAAVTNAADRCGDNFISANGIACLRVPPTAGETAFKFCQVRYVWLIRIDPPTPKLLAESPWWRPPPPHSLRPPPQTAIRQLSIENRLQPVIDVATLRALAG